MTKTSLPWDICTCIHIYIHTYIHTYINTYIFTYIHTIYTYIHTCIHTYIHIIWFISGGVVPRGSSSNPWEVYLSVTNSSSQNIYCTLYCYILITTSRAPTTVMSTTPTVTLPAARLAWSGWDTCAVGLKGGPQPVKPEMRGKILARMTLDSSAVTCRWFLHVGEIDMVMRGSTRRDSL